MTNSWNQADSKPFNEEGVSPNDLFFGSPVRLAKRQVDACNIGESSCRAIGVPGCCPNDNYCYIDPQGSAKCCADGSRCDDPCPTTAYQCTVSATTTCCPRACPAPSGFQCPESVGGGCCSVGSACLSGNSCSPTLDPATVNTVSPSPTDCPSGRFSCPSDAGGGCCNIGETCTAMSSSLYCLAGSGGAFTTRPGGNMGVGPVTNSAGIVTMAGSTATAPASAGLSSGAKAGIGVGTTLGVVLIACLIAGFWLFRRRHRPQREHTAGSSSQGHDAPTSRVPSPAPQSAGTDYFVSEAQPGPFTHSDAAQASGMSTAFATAGNRGAVPVRPEGPGDITSPVEMGETGMLSPGARSELSEEATATPELQHDEKAAAGYFRTKGERSPSPAELP